MYAVKATKPQPSYCAAIPTSPPTLAPGTGGGDAVCRNPEQPANGFTTPVGKTVWQATELIMYDCNPGYELAGRGAGLRFCQPDGTIFGDVPTCERK